MSVNMGISLVNKQRLLVPKKNLSLTKPNFSQSISFQARTSSDQEEMIKNLQANAKKQHMSVMQYCNYLNYKIQRNNRVNNDVEMTEASGNTIKIDSVPSCTDTIGNNKVTTLIDSEQIFNKTYELIDSAKDNIQIQMFEMQNIDLYNDIWPSKGAENVPGWDKQQKIIDKLVEKKQQNPNMNIQVILDCHKWPINGTGDNLKHYNNLRTIGYLKDNNIDVVPYPISRVGGSTLQHAKFLGVDNSKVIVGGMNWGNHSPANHDACIVIEKNNKNQATEVDNIIDEFFNKDWKFSWKSLDNSKNFELPVKNNGTPKPVTAEEKIYVEFFNKYYNNPASLNRYKNNQLNLSNIRPIPKQMMHIMPLTNRPREYTKVEANGEESIRKYISNKLEDCTSLKAELFVLSHKEIVEQIINRHKEAQNGIRPFDVKLIISQKILNEFPYCRKAFDKLSQAGVPIITYKTNDDIDQRLHSKWAVFNDKELLIGSANWSAKGLETNIKPGLRSDYKATNAMINRKMLEQNTNTLRELEEKLGMDNIFEEIVYYMNDPEFLNQSINGYLKSVTEIIEEEPENTDLKKLEGHYKILKNLSKSRPRYQRGNHEIAVVIESPKIAQTFLQQFDKDWVKSKPIEENTEPMDIDYDDSYSDDEIENFSNGIV